MSSAELAETALSMKNVTFDEDDSWTTFEVIENGELGAGNRVQPVYFIYSYSVNEDGSDLQQHRPPPSFQTLTSYFLIKMKVVFGAEMETQASSKTPQLKL